MTSLILFSFYKTFYLKKNNPCSRCFTLDHQLKHVSSTRDIKLGHKAIKFQTWNSSVKITFAHHMTAISMTIICLTNCKEKYSCIIYCISSELKMCSMLSIILWLYLQKNPKIFEHWLYTSIMIYRYKVNRPDLFC